MKQVIFLFILATNILFSQEKDTLNFEEKPKFETKKLIIPATLMMAGSIVLSTENRDFSVTENKNFLAFGGYPEDYLQFVPHVSLYAFE